MKKFMEPMMEVTTFAVVDIITESIELPELEIPEEEE